MDNNNIPEQTAAISPDTLEHAEEKTCGSNGQTCEAVSGYGKFDTLEQLLKAYNSLEGEFTKRCQKLKDAEERIEKLNFGQQDEKAVLERALSDEEFIDERIVSDEIISNKIIASYLSKLYGVKSAPVLSGKTGHSALTPVKKPKSLDEAKKLADILLKG